MKKVKKIPKNLCLLDDNGSNDNNNKPITKPPTGTNPSTDTGAKANSIVSVQPKKLVKPTIIKKKNDNADDKPDNSNPISEPVSHPIIMDTDNAAITTAGVDDVTDSTHFEFELIIDNNEKKYVKNAHGEQVPTYVPTIFERFKSEQGVFGKHKGKINVYQETLKIGDIQFNIDGKPFIIIERKTVMDLHSSIQDKNDRYHDQKMRIINSDFPIKYYLVEGGSIANMPNSAYKFDDGAKNVLYSAIVHTIIRDQIPVIRTFDINDTLRIIEKILETLIQFKSKLVHKYITSVTIATAIGANNNSSDDTVIDWSKTIKMAKKDNLTPGVCYLLQLRQIPGVSHNMAQEIVKVYPTMKALIYAYDACASSQKPGSDEAKIQRAKDNLLKNIDVPSETPGKSRKLGPAVSARIAAYLA